MTFSVVTYKIKTSMKGKKRMKNNAFTFILILLGFSTLIMANDVPDGFTKIKELGGIEEYKLESNDLNILLLEDHSTPVLTFMVTYRVGSRNEVTGTTGATHILEHLMFKGTPTFNKGIGTQIAATLQNVGAQLNATTWLDRTNYYESIPSDQLELAIHLESDRMRNSLLKEEDKNSEMTVVRNEFERGENSPFQALDKVIWATAIQAHPYHHSTIGWHSDIENVPIEKLREFYNTFYWPNNATVVLIGDFEKANAMALIKKYFGAITASPHEIPQVYTSEPKQQGARRVVVKRTGQLGVVGIAHKIPEGTHQDTYALTVLSNILMEGKTSRLYKALIDKNLAVDMFNFYFPFRDPSLFIPYIFLAPNVAHEDVEKVLLEEYEKIKNDGVTEAEVSRAINQITAETAFDRDGSFSIASQLNEAIAVGDWTFYVTFLDNIRNVTAQHVQDVVKKYFIENQSTTGYFIPEIPGGNDSQQANPDALMQPQQKLFYRTNGLNNPFNDNSEIKKNNSLNYEPLAAGGASISSQIKRKKVAGIDVITAKTGAKDVVTFTGSLAAGDFFSPKVNTMIADLTGNLLDKGTTTKGKFELAEELENLGASISFSVGKHTLSFTGKCLKKDLEKVIDLLAEQLVSPALDEEELEKLKTQRTGTFKQLLENTNVRASKKLGSVMFPPGHPNHDISLDRLIEDTDKVTIDQVKAFHKKHYGPKSMIFVAVGDLDDNLVQQYVKKSFQGWKGGISYPSYKKANMTNAGTKAIVRLEEKTSATLKLGLVTGLKKTDSDYLPLYVGNYILGGNFSARLMSIIRDDEGLTYGINSSHQGDILSDGYWNIQGSFAPAMLQQGMESTMREVRRWVNEGVTEEELKNKKTTLIGSYKVQLATTSGLANQILSFVQRGFDVDYLDQYPEKVEALTLKQVNNTIKKYIDPDKIVTVIAGTVDEEGKPIANE